MKATGIVRRIDDLGRVVIPKEIRRTMRIREARPGTDNTDSVRAVLLRDAGLGQAKGLGVYITTTGDFENKRRDNFFLVQILLVLLK